MKVKPPWPVRAKVMREVAAGLKYLHAHHVVHGNLSRHNVVISSDLVAKVCLLFIIAGKLIKTRSLSSVFAMILFLIHRLQCRH